MASTPQSRISTLASAMPVASTQVAAQQKAARDLQLAQLAKAAQPGQAVRPAAQQAGAAMQQLAGQQQVQQAQAGVQQQAQLGQAALQAQQAQSQATIQGQAMGLEKQRMADVQRLAGLSEKAKQEVYDSRMQFARDEMGRTHLNTRQLADFARMTAVSDEQFATRAQDLKQAHDMRLEMLQAAQRKLEQELSFDAQRKENKLDQQQKLDLEKRLVALREAQARAKADAANDVGMISTIGGLAGVGVAVAAGQPALALPAYQAGAAGTTAIYGATR